MYPEDPDWSSFKFPPRPPKKWDSQEDSEDSYSKAPDWAAPPKEVRSWHLDVDNFIIIHPVQRKKIDLNRINTKRRLVQLSDVLLDQKKDEDIASLLRALDEACKYAFSISYAEMLSSGPKSWEWPRQDDAEYIED